MSGLQDTTPPRVYHSEEEADAAIAENEARFQRLLADYEDKTPDPVQHESGN